jgi:hypothetical protein
MWRLASLQLRFDRKPTHKTYPESFPESRIRFLREHYRISQRRHHSSRRRRRHSSSLLPDCRFGPYRRMDRSISGKVRKGDIRDLWTFKQCLGVVFDPSDDCDGAVPLGSSIFAALRVLPLAIENPVVCQTKISTSLHLGAGYGCPKGRIPDAWP